MADPETLDSAANRLSVPKGSRMLTGVPAQELVERSQGELEEHPEVWAAYIFQTVLDQGAPLVIE